MGANSAPTMKPRFVCIQCKVLSDSKSPKFRNGGGPGLRHPSSLGVRPAPASPSTIATVRGNRTWRRSSPGRARARARKDAGTRLTSKPNPTEENKM
jgi:hypothetical protein